MKLKDRLYEKAAKLKTDIPAVFLALKDRRTPLSAKILAAITVIYALSPVDLIPDFIPVIGYLDDLILLPMLIVWTIKLIPEDVWNDCKKRSEGMWQDDKPKKWYYALPFIATWLLIFAVILKIVLSKI